MTDYIDVSLSIVIVSFTVLYGGGATSGPSPSSFASSIGTADPPCPISILGLMELKYF